RLHRGICVARDAQVEDRPTGADRIEQRGRKAVDGATAALERAGEGRGGTGNRGKGGLERREIDRVAHGVGAIERVAGRADERQVLRQTEKKRIGRAARAEDPRSTTLNS